MIRPLVLQFPLPVLHFPPLPFGPAFSVLSVFFVLHFLVLHFQSTQFMLVVIAAAKDINRRPTVY